MSCNSYSISSIGLTLFDMRGAERAPPWKVFKMPNFDVVMTPTMSRNIFEVIWKFWKNSNFWVILESLLQLKRNFDHFKSWNYPFLCVWWVTKSFELIKVPEVCFPGGGLFQPPLMSNAPKNISCQIGSSKYFIDCDKVEAEWIVWILTISSKISIIKMKVGLSDP